MARKNIKKGKITSGQRDMVLEDINEKFSFLVESHSALNKKIDGFYSELRNELINFRGETKANFKAVFEYLSRIDDEIQSVKSEIAELKESLKKKTDQDKLLKLEKRVIILEKEVFNWRKLAQAKN